MKKENIWKVVVIILFVFGLLYLYFLQEHGKGFSFLPTSNQKNQVTQKSSPLQWRVAHYTDKFGALTKEKYITFDEPLRGQFSNSATTDSDLDVLFLITNPYDVNIMLFKYANDNPEKYYWDTVYYIFIEYGNKIQKRLKSYGYKGSDRLSLTETSSKILHDVLMQGGQIKFSIVNSEDQNNTYSFVINDASGYKEAYKLMKGN